MKYIRVDAQEAFDYFLENIVPYRFQDDYRGEIDEWLDKWLNWLIGDKCIEGNDITYLYEWWATGESRLKDFDIDFSIVDEEGE